MKNTVQRIVLLGSAFLGLGLFIGCSEGSQSPLSPAEASHALTETLTTTVNVLQRNTPLANDISVSADIGKAGGTIAIPEAGIKITFPMNAVAPPSKQKSVRITVTALKGSEVAYTFEPHGIEFMQDVKITQDAKLTSAYKDPALTFSKGAYFSDISLLDGVTGTAVVSEFMPTSFDASNSKFDWTIRHFSGYLLASD